MSWQGTVTWSVDREPTIEEFNRLEGNLQWLYDRIYDEVGEVGYFPQASAARRLLCDGSVISKTLNPEYGTLVDKLKAEAGGDSGHPFYHADSDKAVIPDLSSVFIRGMAAGRKAGQFQAGAIEDHNHDTALGSHSHSYTILDGETVVWYGGEFPRKENNSNENDYPRKGTTDATDLGTKSSSSPKSASVDDETRPDNVTLYPLIKY